jgi:ABC transport system ATP-binding/permease protein
MNALHAKGVEVAFGDRMVLKGCNLAVEPRDRLGLVGVNGSGKSTFVRTLAGDLDPDYGEVTRYGSLGWLPQEPRLVGETVRDAAIHAVGWHKSLLDEWQQALDDGEVEAAGALQERIDHHGWHPEQQVDAVLSRVGAPPHDAMVADLSGGEQRRVALALALLGSPDVLLLDEPTNHLDADAVEWLEAFLGGYRGAILLVTHDRYLLEAVAERIVEIEDGRCVNYEGSYGDYLVTRAERRASMERAEDSRLNLLAREAAWAARSPAARSTKQRARLQRLEQLQGTEKLHRDKTFSMDLRTGFRKGGTVVEGHGLVKGYDGRTLMQGVDFSAAPGERIGIVGDNGAGKSTLLRLLMRTESPDAGTVNHAPRVKMAVLDQKRSGLTDNDTVFEAAGNGNDHVTVGDSTIHVAGFLARFLFPRDMLDQKVASLSGGERARLLLAKLLLLGANLLFLDEPTNDLDLSTLRVLEEALLAFDGAAVIVTHDRAFLDRVCTAVVAFEGNGQVTRYASRLQWRRAVAERTPKTAAKVAAKPRKPQKRSSSKEKRELEALPSRIEQLEAEQTTLETQLADPATYQGDIDISALNASLAKLEAEIEAAYARWEQLSD